MKKYLEIKNFYLIIFGISIISLIGAVYIEYILGYKSCKLCLYQRIPYLFAIFISFIGFNYHKNHFWLYLTIFTFLSSSLISGYHVGIENGLLNEFSGCSKINIGITNKKDLLNSLNMERTNCKNVDFRIFGLSLATINFLISAIISVLTVNVIRYEKNK